MNEQLELPIGDLVLKWRYVAITALICWPLVGAAGFYGSIYMDKKKDTKSDQIKLVIVETERVCKSIRAKRIDASLSDGNFYLWCVR